MESTRGRDVLEVAEVLDLLGRAVRRSSRVTGRGEDGSSPSGPSPSRKGCSDLRHPELATSLINLGVQRTLAGDPAAARPLLERALAIREAAFGPDHLLVAAALDSLAGLLMTLRDDAGAKALLERAQRTREATFGAGHPADGPNARQSGDLLPGDGRLHGAHDSVTSARSRWPNTFVGPADLFTLHVLTGVAVVLSELAGDFAGSARLNERLLLMTEQSFGPTDPRLMAPLENLATDLRDLGDYPAAKAAAERSLAIAERAFGPKHREVARSLHTLATVVGGAG